jgi:hypothetical protein
MMRTRKEKAEPKHPAHRSGAVAKQVDEIDTMRSAAELNQDDTRRIPDRTGGQNGAVDQKRNDEQQYHAAGVAHDPHNRTQERIDSGDPDAGDIDDETREQSAPFNKTYGHHP